MHANGCNAILADEMGLGKTLQNATLCAADHCLPGAPQVRPGGAGPAPGGGAALGALVVDDRDQALLPRAARGQAALVRRRGAEAPHHLALRGRRLRRRGRRSLATAHHTGLLGRASQSDLLSTPNGKVTSHAARAPKLRHRCGAAPKPPTLRLQHPGDDVRDGQVTKRDRRARLPHVVALLGGRRGAHPQERHVAGLAGAAQVPLRARAAAHRHAAAEQPARAVGAAQLPLPRAFPTARQHVERDYRLGAAAAHWTDGRRRRALGPWAALRTIEARLHRPDPSRSIRRHSMWLAALEPAPNV
eukprot:scaffold28612_cov63-Phaeocystis_antarctica.AAC.5